MLLKQTMIWDNINFSKKNKYLESSLYTIKVANSNNYKTIHCFCHRSKLSSQVPIRDSALKLNLEEQGLEFGRL